MFKKSEHSKVRLSSKDFKVLAKLIRFIAPFKGTFFIGLLFLVGSTAASLVFPYIFGALIDIVGGKSKVGLNSINEAAIALFAVLILQAIFSYFRILLFAKVSEGAMGNIRQKLYAHMLHLSISFYEKNRLGELTARFTADIGMLRDTLSTTSAEFLRQFATLAIGTTLLFFFSHKLTFFMLMTFPLLVILALIFGKFIKKRSKKTQSFLADSNVIAEESFQAIPIVKSFTNEANQIARYKKSIDAMIKVAVSTAHYRGAFAAFIIAALFGGIIGVLWYGAILVQEGSLTIGSLVTYLFYTIYIGASVGGMGDMFGQIQKAAGASERVLEILEEHTEENIDNNKVSFKMGNIKFNHVSFEYPTRPEVPVLSELNFEIKKGQRIALVGPSGGGKSTITHLISRFYKISKGQILLNDINIENIELHSLRNQIGIVPQDIQLFGGSIRYNILYGNMKADEKAIIEAAKQANAWEFIRSFPDGLDTEVGDRGIQLSGGQKQRIAIARTILKNPSILILDEATSSLDAASEKAVQDALDKLMEGRTSLVIAHRLSSVVNADCIFVVENGQIKEEGQHKDLIAQNGLYKNLVKIQFKEA